MDSTARQYVFTDAVGDLDRLFALDSQCGHREDAVALVELLRALYSRQDIRGF